MKSVWGAISKSKQQKAAQEKKEAKADPRGSVENGEKRKMLRIGEKEHAMVKKASAWLEMGMQEYLEVLIQESFKNIFPDEK